MQPFTCLDLFVLPFDVSFAQWSSGWMPDPVDMDFVPSTGMPTYIILRDDAPPIRFSAERKVSQRQDHSDAQPFGYISAVNIFKTPAGKYVCQESFKATREDESMEHRIEILDDELSAAEFVRRSSLTLDGLLNRIADRAAKRLSQEG